MEKSSLFVRSAVHRLSHDEDNLEYLLIPMIHIGSPKFYKAVSDRLAACGVIFFEGVPSKKVRALTLAYRLLARSSKLGLVPQASMDLGHLRDRMVHADLDGPAFDAGWDALPLRDRLMIGILAPAMMAYLSFVTTRHFIATGIDTDDFSSGGAFLGDDPGDDQLNDLILDQRDRKLVEVIEVHHRENREKRMLAGVMYGAGHMRAVTRFLMTKLGYRVSRSEWLTIFDLP